MTFSFVVIYLPLAILFGYMGYSFAGSNLFWSVFFWHGVNNRTAEFIANS